ncbi:MAG: Carboxypeptidase regulatory-like domain [Thermoplasmata archaeon]|nr:Carboxypeptidase regulatory-like domain [Thermoplasmata archaeon]
MRSPEGLALAMALLLLAGCAQGGGTTAGTEAAAADTGILQGIVVDDAIRPLAGVRIELDGDVNGTSDAAGAFQFGGVPPGAHVVRATKAGFSDTVAQADVRAGEATPLLKLVLITDLSTLAYAETQAIEGYVECGMYGASFRYATCGTGNVASLIACSTANVCLGNVTEDRYIVVQRFAQQPDFLVAEVVWTATQDLGKEMQVYIGTATPEDLAAASTNDYNGTIGPSPLYVTMDKTMLVDSKLGFEAMFLSQTFAAPTLKPCEFGACGVGLVVQQRFTYYLTSFFGFEPEKTRRFVSDGPPLPPA